MPANIMSDEEVIQYTPESVPFVFIGVAQMRLVPAVNNATWLKGQTGLACLAGATAPGDQAIKWFVWSATSTSADDGATVIQPTAIAVSATKNPTGAGRWLSP